jgi:hypothetical protein
MASKMADIQSATRTRHRSHLLSGCSTGTGSTDRRRTPTDIDESSKPRGTIHIGAYLHPDFKTSLRLVQARTGKDIQSLLADALNELFRAHNAPVVDKS